MANQQIERGSWGKIGAAKKQPDRRYRSSGQFKDHDGRILRRSRYGSTSRKAEAALLKLFQQM